METAATEKAIASEVSNRKLAGSIGKNTIFGVLGNLAQVGTRLVTVPIVIHHMGLAGYGIWNIIMTTATYMRFGSVGVKSAFQKYVAEATGNGEYETANKLLSTGTAIMLLLSIACLVPISFYSVRIAHAAGVPPEFLTSSAGAIALLAWIMMMANIGAAFEAIVMGGHRIDLVRKLGTFFTVAEAIGIVVVLRLGFGLFAMAAVMGVSELLFISCCYVASHRIVPQIRIRVEFVTSKVLYELLRFAGSYQLVNLLEVLYASIIPFAVLRAFGATESGVYAVVSRIVISAYVLLDAFLPPILSGGAMVYASGSEAKMRGLLVKAFKVTLALSLFPLGFIAVFGPLMAVAWTGQTDPSFRIAFFWVAMTGIFRSFSLLSLVLYRVSGKAVLDNIRQVIRIIVILTTVVFAKRLGFNGVLAGLTSAELVGMVFMMYALTKTFKLFETRALLPDAFKMITASVLVLGAGIGASFLPLPGDHATRFASMMRLGVVCLACAAVTWPVLRWTKSITSAESGAILAVFFPARRRNIVATPDGSGGL